MRVFIGLAKLKAILFRFLSKDPEKLWRRYKIIALVKS